MQLKNSWALAGEVLIPILMDYPLGDVVSFVQGFCPDNVLIPILMDYPLGAERGEPW